MDAILFYLCQRNLDIYVPPTVPDGFSDVNGAALLQSFADNREYSEHFPSAFVTPFLSSLLKQYAEKLKGVEYVL